MLGEPGNEESLSLSRGKGAMKSRAKRQLLPLSSSATAVCLSCPATGLQCPSQCFPCALRLQSGRRAFHQAEPQGPWIQDYGPAENALGRRKQSSFHRARILHPSIHVHTHYPFMCRICVVRILLCMQMGPGATIALMQTLASSRRLLFLHRQVKILRALRTLVFQDPAGMRGFWLD